MRREEDALFIIDPVARDPKRPPPAPDERLKLSAETRFVKPAGRKRGRHHVAWYWPNSR
jgi:hypothetical protein